MILKNARKLKDTGYYINDFSKETVEIRNCGNSKRMTNMLY